MSTGAITGIIVALVIVVIVAAIGGSIWTRRQRLRKRFGPEYDRVLAESDSRRLAETEAAGRERRVQNFQLRELSDADREKFGTQWADVQELFVDSPAEAIGHGQDLVEVVMRERGYPVAEFDQAVADLSVDHARTLDHFRSAHEVSEKAATDNATTEELRTALLDYRELFDELLGVPALAATGSRVNGAGHGDQDGTDLVDHAELDER